MEEVFERVDPIDDNQVVDRIESFMPRFDSFLKNQINIDGGAYVHFMHICFLEAEKMLLHTEQWGLSAAEQCQFTGILTELLYAVLTHNLNLTFDV